MENHEAILKKKREWWAKWHQENREEILRKKREKKWASKEEVLTHYGNGKYACVKCGFNNKYTLTLDHMEGGGNAERKRLKSQGGVSFYRWLKKNNYPLGYQTLCMNCQWIKRMENHEL